MASSRRRYNALGQRTTKQVHKNGLVYPFTYLYGPDGQLLGEVEYLSSGRKKRAQYFVWLDGLPLAALELSYASDGSIANSKTTYLHADHLNTPRLATNQSGQLVWSWQSDAFGVGTANTDVDGDGIHTDIPLRFPGQIADIHSSLHYNYFRDYDPETGRYVESDPIGLAGGLNTYGYVDGNPANLVDPTGESATGAVATWVATDIAVPEPSDAAWPKWVAYGAAFAGAVAVDLAMCPAEAPSKAECNKAIKLLEQAIRLAEKNGKKLPQKRIDDLRRKINDGTITSADLPASIQAEFPTRFLGMNLAQIRQMCGKGR